MVVDVAPVTVLRTIQNVVNVDNTNSTKVARKLARSNGQVTAGRGVGNFTENFLRANFFSSCYRHLLMSRSVSPRLDY